MRSWHDVSAEETFAQLDSHPSGLSQAEATRRQITHGFNTHSPRLNSAVFSILQEYVRSLNFWAFLVLIGIFCLTQQWGSAFITFLLWFLYGAIYLATRYQTYQLLHQLEQSSAFFVKVKRDGKVTPLTPEKVTIGDCVVLEIGDIIPATLRIYQSSGLTVDERQLGGNFRAQAREIAPLPADTPVSMRNNLALPYSQVTGGSGAGVVVGLITKEEWTTSPFPSPFSADEQTDSLNHLQNKIRSIGIKIVLPLAAILIWQSSAYSNNLGLAIANSLALTAIGLILISPLMLTSLSFLLLAKGANSFRSSKNVFRNLEAVEHFAHTDTLICQPVGTMTGKQFKITNILLPSRENLITHEVASLNPFTNGLAKLLKSTVLTSEAGTNPRLSDFYDPLEYTFLELAQHLSAEGVQSLQQQEPIFSLPYSAKWGFNGRCYPLNSKQVVFYLKGSAEKILERTQFISRPHEVSLLSGEERAELRHLISDFARKGEQVTAFSYLEMDKEQLKEVMANPEQAGEYLKNTVLLGCICAHDTLSLQSARSLHALAELGVQVKFLSYLHPVLTKKLIEATRYEYLPLSEKEFAQATTKEISQSTVLYDLSPEHCLDLVQTLQKRDRVVAYIGTSLWEKKALEKADIGIISYPQGPAALIPVASVITESTLLSTLEELVRSAQQTVSRLYSFLTYLPTSILLCGSVFIVTTYFSPFRPSFTPLEFLFITVSNAVAIPLLFLSDQPTSLIKPVLRRRKYLNFSQELSELSLVGGLTASAATLFIYFLSGHFSTNFETVRSLTFLSLVWSSIWLTCSLLFSAPVTFSTLVRKPFGKFLLGYLVVVLIIFLTPALQEVFNLVPLGIFHWILAMGSTFFTVLITNVYKVQFSSR